MLTAQNCRDGLEGTGPFLFPHTVQNTPFSSEKGRAPTRFQAGTRAAAGGLQPALI